MPAPVIDRLVQVTRNQGQPVPMFTTAARWVDGVALTANTAATYTVPSGAAFLRLTPTVIPTYGNLNAAAVVPTTSVTNGTASFPIGGQTWLVVHAGDSLSLICASACFVTIEVWN